MWIRLETGWQRDPYVITLHGTARHVLNTLWTLAAEKGRPTYDAMGKPEHAELALQWLEPTFLARECGLEVDVVRRAIEQLRTPLPATEWSPEAPARITIDIERRVAVVRKVGHYQATVLRDRDRKRGKK